LAVWVVLAQGCCHGADPGGDADALCDEIEHRSAGRCSGDVCVTVTCWQEEESDLECAAEVRTVRATAAALDAATAICQDELSLGGIAAAIWDLEVGCLRVCKSCRSR